MTRTQALKMLGAIFAGMTGKEAMAAKKKPLEVVFDLDRVVSFTILKNGRYIIFSNDDVWKALGGTD
jgi:hypothetical protein